MNSAPPLFESYKGKNLIAKRLFASFIFVNVVLICVYRVVCIPSKEDTGRWAWIGMLACELWFSFYWVITQSVRWNPLYRRAFPDRLSQRFEKELPAVDVFVCTADPTIEPPTMVINTVLSVMAYDYPPEKLSVYLSDDAGSEFTFYALLEASKFARFWIPFCKKYNVEPRSPAAYISESSETKISRTNVEYTKIKELYKEMEKKIGSVMHNGKISEEFEEQNKELFYKDATRHNHPAIVKILIDGRNQNDCESEGCKLPTLVYMAREKKPEYHHNFKAGAMNSLLRVSSAISNGPIILNVDCDMYSNDSKSVRNALCFFMDEQKGNEFAYVQFPQNFIGLSKNDIYANSLRIFSEVDFHGFDGYGGSLYIGSGCFHRRESLLGKKCSEADKKLKVDKPSTENTNSIILEEARNLVACSYEQNTQWGKEMGLKYGCPVEDVITGLSIQCNGWKSVYYNPQRKAFLGVAPMTLDQTLVQHKRWSEGHFQIFLSKYCPFIYGHGKIPIGLQMCYSAYCLWAPNSLPTLYYVIVPLLYLLNGVSLFPSVTDAWITPFSIVILGRFVSSLGESLSHGSTLQGWWNEQRIWLYKRTTSYLFALTDSTSKLLGVDKLAFIITPKVVDEDVSKRYEDDIMEFGSSSLMFTILSTVALLNLFGLVTVIIKMSTSKSEPNLDSIFVQILLCGTLVLINLPIYHALFFRSDGGRMHVGSTLSSLLLALMAYVIPMCSNTPMDNDK